MRNLTIILFFTIQFCDCTNILIAQSTGSVGIKITGTPNTTLDINGSVAFREGTALNIAGTTINDIALSTEYSLYRITGPAAAFTITGFASGVNGRILTIVNASGFTMTLANDASTSTAANRIYTGGSNFTVPNQGSATFQYNSTLLRWILTGTSGSNSWNLRGNSGTTPGTDFIGTTDWQPIIFKTDGTEAMRITPLRQIGMGVTNPHWESKLHIEGGSIVMGSDNDAAFSSYPDSSYKIRIRGDVSNNTDQMYMYTYYENYDISQFRLNVGDNGLDNNDAFQIGSFDWVDNVWYPWSTIKATGIGVGTTSPNTKLDIDGGLSIRPSTTVNLTADNQAITVGNRSFLTLSSDNATASNRTFTLSSGLQSGQVLVILLTNNSAELADSGNCQLNSTFSMGANDTISLIWNGSTWFETSRSNN